MDSPKSGLALLIVTLLEHRNVKNYLKSYFSWGGIVGKQEKKTTNILVIFILPDVLMGVWYFPFVPDKLYLRVEKIVGFQCHAIQNISK